MNAPVPVDEQARLDALRSFAILDSAPEREYEDLVMLASQICGTPVALVTLLDEGRQWFKARVGLDATETAREHAFCAHTIVERETMIVNDATADARFEANPLVTGDPNIRFYAGAPLVTSDGHALGTLCVIDVDPRDEGAFVEEQIRALEALSRQVTRLIEYRKVSTALADALASIRRLAPLVPICAWCDRIRDDEQYWADVAEYLKETVGAHATHGICPDCESEVRGEIGVSQLSA